MTNTSQGAVGCFGVWLTVNDFQIFESRLSSDNLLHYLLEFLNEYHKIKNILH